VSGIIRRHRWAVGSRWRKLNPAKLALLVLVYLRKGETFAQLAAGFGIGTTTVWRYVSETVSLLAVWAPKLREAVRDAKKAGYAYVVLDGTLIPIGRVAADRPFYGPGLHRPLPSWVWYQGMADFAQSISGERAGRRVVRAIQGKGAFRRFEDHLREEHPGLLSAWYAFRDACARRRAVQWLADNSLIDNEAPDRFLASYPRS
jgi:DDE superfamily endonuclease/uncharacterized protein UPF0158